MIKTIRKIGTSLGVILPTSDIRAFGLNEGDPVVVVLEKGEVRLIPLTRKPDLAETAKSARQFAHKYEKALEILQQR